MRDNLHLIIAYIDRSWSNCQNHLNYPSNCDIITIPQCSLCLRIDVYSTFAPLVHVLSHPCSSFPSLIFISSGYSEIPRSIFIVQFFRCFGDGYNICKMGRLILNSNNCCLCKMTYCMLILHPQTHGKCYNFHPLTFSYHWMISISLSNCGVKDDIISSHSFSLGRLAFIYQDNVTLINMSPSSVSYTVLWLNRKME